MNGAVLCPICTQPMNQIRRGATLAKRGPAYVCPLDEAETWLDEQDHLHRFAKENRTHGETVRVWHPDELEVPV
jgi:hypothetical protein